MYWKPGMQDYERTYNIILSDSLFTSKSDMQFLCTLFPIQIAKRDSGKGRKGILDQHPPGTFLLVLLVGKLCAKKDFKRKEKSLVELYRTVKPAV